MTSSVRLRRELDVAVKQLAADEGVVAEADAFAVTAAADDVGLSVPVNVGVPGLIMLVLVIVEPVAAAGVD